MALFQAFKERCIVAAPAVYGGSMGPSFETPAEIALLSAAGCTVVGMTSDLEATLAYELGVDYASIGVVSNYAASAERPVSSDGIMVEMRDSCDILTSVISAFIGSRSQ